MLFQSNNTSKTTLSFVIIIMLLSGFFGVSYIGMNNDMNGVMDHCPFMPGASTCTMTLFGHISASANFFNALLTTGNLLVITLIILALALFSFFTIKLFSPPLLYASLSVYSRKYVSSNNFLQEFFSNGILNPKSF